MHPVVPLSKVGSELHYGDATVAAHIVGWVADQAWRSPFHLFDAPIYYPRSDALLNHSLLLVPSALGAPLWWISHNFALVYNFLLYLSTFLTLAAVYWGLRAFTPVNRWGAVAAAVAATLTTDRYWHIVGHLGHLWGALYVLAFFAGWYFVARPRWTGVLAVAGILLLSLFTDFYMLVYSGFALLFGVVTALAVLRIGPRWSHAGGLGAALVLFAILAFPYVRPYFRAASEHPTGLRSSLTFCEINSASPYGWLLPPYQSKRLVTPLGAVIGRRTGPRTHMEDCQFIGYALLVFLFAETVRLVSRLFRRRLQPMDWLSLLSLAFAFFCIVLSLGPRILGIHGPFYYFYILILKYSGFFRNPTRFAFLVQFLTAFPVAVFITSLARERKWVAPVLAIPFVLAVLYEHHPTEILGRLPIRRPDVVANIDRYDPTHTEPFVVVPDPGTGLVGIWAYPGWRPAANGFRDCPLFPDYEIFRTEIEDFPSTRSLGAIDKLGIHWIVCLIPDLTARAKANRHLDLLETRQGFSLFRIVDPGAPSAEWRAEWESILRRVQSQREDIPGGESETIVLADFTSQGTSPVQGTNIEAESVPGEGLRVTLLGTHISSFEIPVPEEYQETLFDEIELVFQAGERFGDAAVFLVWGPTDQPRTVRSSEEATLAPGSAPGEWTARFRLCDHPFYYVESRITHLEFEIILAEPESKPSVLVREVRAIRPAELPAPSGSDPDP